MAQSDINEIGFAIFKIDENGIQERNMGQFVFFNENLKTILRLSGKEDLTGMGA